MNAVLRPLQPVLAPMREADVPAVILIERVLYEFPWSPGNFSDSLRAGYVAEVLKPQPAAGELLGYVVAMSGADELHLLNLSVAPSSQGQGHARFMLDALCAQARARRIAQLWLEVRESNARARALYERYGFRHIGRRRGYYPAPERRREDAVVMSLQLNGGER